jgi:nitrogen fixation NifU-like protein
MSLNELYHSQLLEHNRAPRRRHELADATHSARGLDALCGDDLSIWLRVIDGRIEAASWSGEACVVTTASASMLSDWLIGRSRDEVATGMKAFIELLQAGDEPDRPELGQFNALAAVGRFPSRVRNALLPWKTALDALDSRP